MCLPVGLAWLCAPVAVSSNGMPMLFACTDGIVMSATVRNPAEVGAWVFGQKGLVRELTAAEISAGFSASDLRKRRATFLQIINQLPYITGQCSIGCDANGRMLALAIRPSHAVWCAAWMGVMLFPERLHSFFQAMMLSPKAAFLSDGVLVFYDASLLPKLPVFLSQVPAEALPAAGGAFQIRPDEAMRQHLATQTGSRGEILQACWGVWSIDAQTLAWRGQCSLARDPFDRARRMTARKYDLPEQLTTLPMPDVDGATLRASVSVPLAMGWVVLGRILFDAEGEPTPAWSDPMSILAWRALDEVILAATGGVTVAIYPERVLPSAPLTMLPVPRAQGAVAVRDAATTFSRFSKRAETVMAYFRRPTGDPLWQAVRQECDVRIGPSPDGMPRGRMAWLRLQDLFFHGKDPCWLVRDDAPECVWWMTDPPSEMPAMSAGMNASRVRTLGRDVFVQAVCAWDVSDDEVNRLEALVLDKLEHAAWGPRAWGEKAARFFAVGRRLRALSAAGQVSMVLRDAMLLSAEKTKEKKVFGSDEKTSFTLDMEGQFELNQPLTKKVP